MAVIAVKELNFPFVISGGVASGRQLAAAILCFGAVGVNCGTLFMASKESEIHINIKKAIINSNEYSTTHVFESLNFHERVYKNKTALQVRQIEKEYPGDFTKIRHLVSGAKYKESFKKGNTQDSIWSLGACCCLIDEIKSVKEIVFDLNHEAKDIINTFQNSLIHSKL